MRFLLLLLLPFVSCVKPIRSFEKYRTPKAPDYSQASCWAALPTEKDQADVLPKNADLKDGQKDAKVDVFFIHPTSNFSARGWNAGLKNRVINTRTNTGSIRNQATVFNGSCAVYAPRYRQATLYSFVDIYGGHTSKNKNGEKAMAFAYQDVKKAFEYFLLNYSKGRPFIIASHSQGTWHARTLIKEIIEKDSSLFKRFVAGYLIGGGTPQKDFTVLVPCDSATQTGCFVCWNSMKWGASDKYATSSSLECVNPISWKRDGKPTEMKDSKGGAPVNLGEIQPQHVCAQCTTGLLWTTKPAKTGYLKNVKNYHVADYNLFWLDIRKNVDLRVEQYLLKN